ncbi:efflux RND transporter periplasmic adaptor subunit [Candidatus Parcubacteria bacterium]|nr:MAG: efflux RND transporter periplasmic adaptor subunit [Candidatus Parcubacteria bacterium]
MKKIIITIIAIAVVAVASRYGYSLIKKPERIEAVTLKKGGIIQKVEITGKTKPAKSVDLSFQVSGKVSGVFAEAGDKVYAGQTIAQLDQKELLANLAQAQASKESEEARLADLKSGTKPEDIEISETQVNAAQIALKDALENFADKAGDSYTKADDAVYNKVDQMLSNPKTVNPQLNIAIPDSQMEKRLEEERVEIEVILKDWSALNGKINADAVKGLIGKVKENNESAKNFLNNMAAMVNGLAANAGLAQTSIDAYKKDISTARDNVNAAISAIIAAEEKANTAESNLLLAQKELGLKKAGNTKEAIQVQESRVKQYEAQIISIEAQLEKTYIRSPVSGVLTKQEAKTGQVVTANALIVSVIGDSGLEVEAYVPELNIGKIGIGNEVDIKFDAFPEEKFSGKIVYIDPAETVIEGISNFKVKIALGEKYDKLKSGLTADLEIVFDSKKDVLTAPIYALVQRGGKYFAQKLISPEGSAVEEVPVILGMMGDDGYAEILSGLEEGDMIALTGFKNK